MAPTAPTHARTSYALPRCAPRCETPNGDSTSPAHQRWDYRRSGLTAATPTQTRPTSASRGSATCGPQLSSGGEARQPLGVEVEPDHPQRVVHLSVAGLRVPAGHVDAPADGARDAAAGQRDPRGGPWSRGASAR